jgi:hypothetical protein
MAANRPLLLAVAGVAASLALPTTAAFGQTQFGGVITLKLSDPGGGEPWRSQRLLLHTFSTMRECESQKEGFIGFHVRRVKGHGLVTASGEPPVVEVESIECFTVRENIVE